MNRRQILRDALAFGSSLALANTLPTVASAQRRHGGGVGGASKALVPQCNQFFVGCQAGKYELTQPNFPQVAAANFNLLTPGNEMKWTKLRPTPDTFNFTDGDWIVNFAQQNQMQVHGHNLCWNSTANPAWFKTTLNKSNGKQYLTDHITKVMQHFKGQVISWDVVNEPVVPWSKRPDGLYPGPWIDAIGPDYISTAFHAAAEADPKPLRILNCYQVEHDTPDQDRGRANTLALVKKLVQQKVPIQAVGIESHLNATTPLAGQKFRDFLSEIVQTGLQVLVTELDIDDTEVQGSPADRDKIVGKAYHDYLAQFKGISNLNAVIFWTISDKFDWLNTAKDPKLKRMDGQAHRTGVWDQSMKEKTQTYDSIRSVLQTLC